MYDKLSVVSLARSRMDWVARRQEVLSENIANANTPKFAPSDLKPFNFKDALNQTIQPVGVAATNDKHIVPVVKDPMNVVRSRKTYESSPDGNAVVVEEQMVKIGEAKSSYEIAAGLFQKQFKLLRTALGKN
ncbi:flagellar basal body protein [Magnetospirillum sp. UT-4]|uniref:flagellar basal body protein n=1 Tax=Magnetospirillum sp. UT-4 TaxID=2681467 RepID=UPI0013801398|nr:flagellar basal body protein [Magnetospirillum sp. UT-4]CAA7612787.1 Flagellar basal-body rod protein FlgB [Magnetospirillum sp. UT-4]